MSGFGSTELILTVFLCMCGSVALLAVMMVMLSIRIVPASQRLKVFRLGQELGERGPGLVILIPFIDRGELVEGNDQPHQPPDA